ncbi:MAG: hypothetical protein KGL39_46315, partial [Patescibacteria group bacterium]|nr:hypothetical protein [Patescibacteria group bacterium]
MKTIESDPRLPAWLNAMLNRWPFCLDTHSIKSIAFAIDNQGFYMPGTRSQFYNGYVFLRFSVPFG